MPLYELLVYLEMNGDSIASHVEPPFAAAEIHTALGHRYVRSQNGLVLTSTGWAWKYIWCRV